MDTHETIIIIIIIIKNVLIQVTLS